MNVGFIGVGNMGGAIAKCIGKSDHINLLLSDYNTSKSQEVIDECGGQILPNDQIVQKSDVVFIGVKPQMIKDVFNNRKIKKAAKLNKNIIWVSFVAGVKIEKLKKILKSDYIVRIMPNTPVLYGCGMTTAASENQQNAIFITNLLSPTGLVVQVNESLIDISTAIAGCGPAFVYKFIEALVKAGIDNGLSKTLAKQFAAQTVLGSAVMVNNSKKDIVELIDNVCSPGGATIEGVNYLSNNDFDSIVEEAVNKSYEKSKKLG